MGLDLDTPITRSLRRYRERGIISHCIKHGNDLTDRVVSRRNCYLLVIRVRDYISEIHVVEHDLIGCEQNNDGSDGLFPKRVRVDHFKRSLMGEL